MKYWNTNLPTLVSCSIVWVVFCNVRVNPTESELLVLSRTYGLHNKLGVRIRWFTIIFCFVGSFSSGTVYFLTHILTWTSTISARSTVTRGVRWRWMQVMMEVGEATKMASGSVSRTDRTRVGRTDSSSRGRHGTGNQIFLPDWYVDS